MGHTSVDAEIGFSPRLHPVVRISAVSHLNLLDKPSWILMTLPLIFLIFFLSSSKCIQQTFNLKPCLQLTLSLAPLDLVARMCVRPLIFTHTPKCQNQIDRSSLLTQLCTRPGGLTTTNIRKRCRKRTLRVVLPFQSNWAQWKYSQFGFAANHNY